MAGKKRKKRGSELGSVTAFLKTLAVVIVIFVIFNYICSMANWSMTVRQIGDAVLIFILIGSWPSSNRKKAEGGSRVQTGSVPMKNDEWLMSQERKLRYELEEARREYDRVESEINRTPRYPSYLKMNEADRLHMRLSNELADARSRVTALELRLSDVQQQLQNRR